MVAVDLFVDTGLSLAFVILSLIEGFALVLFAALLPLADLVPTTLNFVTTFPVLLNFLMRERSPSEEFLDVDSV